MEYNKERINPGDIWQHYKEKDYRIIAVSRSTDDLSWSVVYEALYDNEISKIWHRSLDEFLSSVEVNGKIVARFTKKIN